MSDRAFQASHALLRQSKAPPWKCKNLCYKFPSAAFAVGHSAWTDRRGSQSAYKLWYVVSVSLTTVFTFLVETVQVSKDKIAAADAEHLKARAAVKNKRNSFETVVQERKRIQQSINRLLHRKASWTSHELQGILVF